MATDDADPAPSQLEGEVQEAPTEERSAAVVGEYTWDDFLREHGESTAAERLYERFNEAPGSERWGETDTTLGREDWDRTSIEPAEYLGFPPWELEARLGAAHHVAETITESSSLVGYEQTPVIKDIYGWEDYKREYFYTEEGEQPTDDEGEAEEFDAGEALGFDPETLGSVMADHERAGKELTELIDERTVDVNEDVDEDAFFSDEEGRTTVVNRYDLEKTVPMAKKLHFREEDRYWVNEPYSFVVIFHSTKENEKKYYVVQPHLNEIEKQLQEYLSDKLRAAIKYEQEGEEAGDEEHRRSIIENQTRELLDRYDLYEEPKDRWAGGLGNKLAKRFDLDPNSGLSGRLVDALGYEAPLTGVRNLEGIAARPEPVLVEEDADTLNEYQVEKLLYFLERNFIGYERIDGIKHDINVEDISCDGYNSPVFVYHSDYEQIITNIYHGETELDNFVVKLAQRSGKGISKRRPQVDATLPDGSRAQLTLGREVSDHGTNYTIRQFKDVPFTPVDLINWKTFSLDEVAFLWLCIENHKSLIFAGGTASGKTTSLNAVSLFIPSNTKIVSIEDTREVELPQRNWIASVTRPSFSDDDKGDVDEFDLLEAALRQRPDYIVMGEVRGEEGRDLFQVMSTGHTSYSTFHADNVGEVLKRFTTEPINVSKTMFTALDLVSVQTSTRVKGRKVRRNKSLTEINHYDAENDEINVQDVYQWQAETDEFLKMGDSNTLDDIMFDRGWNRERLDEEIFKRQVVLAYLIDKGLNTYTQVAATFQAFINDPETILTLMANEGLESSLEDLREMESVHIDIDPDKEAMVPRPEPSDEIAAEARAILERADAELFEDLRGEISEGVAEALIDTEPQDDIEVTSETAGELPSGGPEADRGAQEPTVDGRSDGDEPALDEEPTPALSAGDSADRSADSEESADMIPGAPDANEQDEDDDSEDVVLGEPETADDEPVTTLEEEPTESADEDADDGADEEPTIGEPVGESDPSERALASEPDHDSGSDDVGEREWGTEPDTDGSASDEEIEIDEPEWSDSEADESETAQEVSELSDSERQFGAAATDTEAGADGDGGSDDSESIRDSEPDAGAESHDVAEPDSSGLSPEGGDGSANSDDGEGDGDTGELGGIWGSVDEDWEDIAPELEADGDGDTAKVDSLGVDSDEEEE
ncbi:MAG: ATPase, T2SS/T4P/T4SS family [Halolamina sp.]|uniref:ATPase, T2SS/T4P/T4SS family n=1 Tax=Halolamina sp. TaxID=1940283 RepID=UPI002FC36CCA